MNKTKIIECACGCGKNLIAFDKKGRPRQFLHGHNVKGRHWKWTDKSRHQLSVTKTGQTTRSANPHWKGGRYVGSWGYVWVLCPNHPCATKMGYVREHRLVMEQTLGRYLSPEEIPHHINGIKHDNRPENLFLLANQSTHRRKHLCKELV